MCAMQCFEIMEMPKTQTYGNKLVAEMLPGACAK